MSPFLFGKNRLVKREVFILEMIVMSDGEKSKLEPEQEALLASIKARRAAVEVAIAEVERTKRDVMWTLNNKWLNLKVRLSDFDRWIKDIEGEGVIPGYAGVGENGRVKVTKGEPVSCIKCGKVVIPGRWLYENGYCYRCERNRQLRLEHLVVARSAKLDREFKATISDGK